MEFPSIEKYGGPPEKRTPRSLEQVLLTERERTAIHDLEYPSVVILNSLRAELEAGKYSALVGDDASGRIPTLVINTAVRDIYDAKGYRYPEVRFVAGSSGINETIDEIKESKFRAIEEFVKSLKEDLEKKRGKVERALIITDTISSGESIETLIKGFKQNGWDADVASIGQIYKSADIPNKSKHLSAAWGTKVVIGSDEEPQIYSRTQLGGVKKNIQNLHSSRREIFDAHLVRQARQVANEVGHKVAKRFLDNSL